MAKPNFKLSKRMVSARFWVNPLLSRLVKKSGIPNLKLTMIGLWAFADEAGIFEWQPEIVASLIYGLDSEEKRVSVEPAMNAMAEAGFLIKVEVGGKFYGVWPNWGEHNDFRDNKSRYPDVFATLDRPRKGETTLESPQRPSHCGLGGASYTATDHSLKRRHNTITNSPEHPRNWTAAKRRAAFRKSYRTPPELSQTFCAFIADSRKDYSDPVVADRRALLRHFKKIEVL